MENLDDFGSLLKRFRQEAGLSQNGLARAAGMDSTNVNRIEASKQGQPRKTTIIKLVRGLGLSLTDDRAQMLFDAAAQMAKPKPIPAAVMHAQFNRRPKGKNALQPKLRELKRIYLRGLELVAEIEKITAEEIPEEKDEA